MSRKATRNVVARKVVSILIIVLLFSLGGCAKEDTKTEENEPMKIGVVIYRGDDAFISALARSIEKEVKKKEEQFDQKIILNILDAKNSQSSQNDLVDNFINKDYDAICINMVDRTSAAVIVDKAKKAEIPIIFFNREPVEDDMKIWDKAYYVGTNAKEAGALEGQIVVDTYKQRPETDKNQDGKLQYVILEGEQVHQDALIRTEYSVQTITQAGIRMEKLDSGTGNWLRSQAYAKTIVWISEYGQQIEMVLANNDEMALGAIEALREYGMLEAGPIILGIDGSKDALEAIDKGEMLGSVVNNTTGQADAILSIACELIQGEDPQNSVKYLRGHYARIPHYSVTKENVEELLNSL